MSLGGSQADLGSAAPTAPPPYEPAVMRWRRRIGPWIKRKLVPPGAVKRRWWWNRLFVQINEPFFFKDQSERDIFIRLLPARRRAVGVLEEAQRLLEDDRARAEHVERRATALQGAVAIAATFVFAGAGLLLTAANPPSGIWRNLMAIPFGFTVLCLAATGFRALRATVRVHAFEYPDPEGPLARADLSESRSQLRQAAELLYAYGRNQPIVDYQVAQMRAAGHWFGAALAGSF